MLRDEVIKILKNCVKVIKDVKDYNFEIICVDNGKPTSDYDKKKWEDDNRTVFHITMSFDGIGNEQKNQHCFELTKIIPNNFTDEDKLEKSKSILTELNKAANDFKAGKEYEPTYMDKLRNIFKLSGMLSGGGDWYI